MDLTGVSQFAFVIDLSTNISFSHCEARQRIDPMLPESTITGSNSWTSRDQSVSESEPLRWKHSLHDLLRSSDGEEAFAKFLRSEYSGENLTFWLAAKRYKRGPGNNTTLSSRHFTSFRFSISPTDCCTSNLRSTYIRRLSRAGQSTSVASSNDYTVIK